MHRNQGREMESYSITNSAENRQTLEQSSTALITAVLLGYILIVRRFSRINRVVIFMTILISLATIRKGLQIATNSDKPIVVLFNDEGTLNLERGDILFLINYGAEQLKVGDIVVFSLENKDMPRIARVLELRRKEDGTVEFFTNSKNEILDDSEIKIKKQLWSSDKSIIGVVRFFLPGCGWAIVHATEYPIIKYVVLAILSGYFTPT